MKPNNDNDRALEFLNNAFTQVTNELHGESERACAIIGGAFLDDLLGELLEIYLVQNHDATQDLLSSENVNAPLGSFGARILTAYAIGLLPKDNWHAFQKVKKIRNRFAHDLNLSFDDSSISKLCANLAPLTTNYFMGERTSREIYVNTVAFLSGGPQNSIYMTSNFGVKGSLGAVLRLASRGRKTSG